MPWAGSFLRTLSTLKLQNSRKWAWAWTPFDKSIDLLWLQIFIVCLFVLCQRNKNDKAGIADLNKHCFQYSGILALTVSKFKILD